MYGFHKVFIISCEKEERKFLKMSKKVHQLEVFWCPQCPREQLHFTPLSLVRIWISHHSLFSIPLDPGRLVLSPRGSSREKPSSSTSQEFGFPAKNENLLQRSQSTSAELRLFPLLREQNKKTPWNRGTAVPLTTVQRKEKELYSRVQSSQRWCTNWGHCQLKLAINPNQFKSNQIKSWFLRRGENRSTWRKTPRCRVENQQTQLTL